MRLAPILLALLWLVPAASAQSPSAHGDADSALHRTLNGTFEEQQTLDAPGASGFDTEGLNVGYSVAFDGDRAVAGSNAGSGPGRAFVYERVAGTWQETAVLSIGVETDVFGGSVAISGDRILIGARYSATEPGSAYVYDYDGSAWTQTARLQASDGVLNNGFGNVVELEGDRALIGAFGTNGATGAAYVFDLAGGEWSETARLAPSELKPVSRFGHSIALSGDRVMVGAYFDGTVDYSAEGAAYVFDLIGGVWTQSARLTASDEIAGANFGYSVALDGDRAAVGAPFRSGASPQQGATYVFDLAGGEWAESAVADPAPANGGRFGVALSLSGDRLMASTLHAGAYVFDLTAGTWVQQALLHPTNYSAGSPQSLCISGDRLIMGVPSDWAAGGAAVIYDLGEGTWNTSAVLRPDPLDGNGYAVDVDGTLAVVGAPLAGPDARGAAFVYEASGGVWSHVATLQASGGAPGDRFGSSVSVSGGRIVVGAPYNSEAGRYAGAAYVFDLTAGTWSETESIVSPPETGDTIAGGQFGTAVSLDGDRMLIGAPYRRRDFSSVSSMVFVYDHAGGAWERTQDLTSTSLYDLGSAVSLSGDRALLGSTTPGTSGGALVFELADGTWTETELLTSATTGSRDQFGISVALDGARALVGRPTTDPRRGLPSAIVFEFDGGTWSETASLVASDGNPFSSFGHSVSLDGERALVGAYDSRGTTPGASYVFDLTDGAWAETQKLTAASGAIGDRFGWAVALSGDAVLIGADRGDTPSSDDVGTATVFSIPPPVPYRITGAPGWRTLALPKAGLGLGGGDVDLGRIHAGYLEPIHTAGYLGADRDQRNARGTANVFLHDEATGAFTPPKRMDSVQPGVGFWVYVQEDDDSYTAGVQGGFPKLLDASGGTPVTSDHTFALSYTPEAPVPGNNLLGNPYDQAIDWDHPSWTRTDVGATVYVWDPAYNGGDYRLWDGETGDLTDGVIPAGQGFHVTALGAGASLTVTEDAKVGIAGALYGLTASGEAGASDKAASGARGLAFRLSGTVGSHERESRAWVTLSPEATLGLDARDGQKLAGAPGSDALRLFSLVPEGHVGMGSALVITSLPEVLAGAIEIPLHAEALDSGEEVDARAVLSWEAASLPDGWTATLRDALTGEVFDLSAAGETALTLHAANVLTSSPQDRAAKRLSPDTMPPVPAARPLRAHSASGARFMLLVSTDGASSPEARAGFAIGDIGPNPTSGPSRLPLSLPNAGAVAVDVFDSLGRQVATWSEALNAGDHQLRVPTAGLAAGTYVVRVVTPEGGATRRITVVR